MKRIVSKFLNSKVCTYYLSQWRLYKQFYNSRKALAALSDTMLEDIGITKEEAEKEAAKPFWKSDTNFLKDQTTSKRRIASLDSSLFKERTNKKVVE